VAAEDSEVQRYVKEALARSGYSADACGDSRMILEEEKTTGHSFVIMNGGDAGVEIVRTLRRQGTRIPVIFLSGNAKRMTPDSGMGIVERLSTPFTLETLQLAIAKVCHIDRAGPPSGPSVPQSGRGSSEHRTRRTSRRS
jgi:DNA-binding response OmpR family regulator